MIEPYLNYGGSNLLQNVAKHSEMSKTDLITTVIQELRQKSSQCVENACQCVHGFGVRGTDCPDPTKFDCATCLVGFTLTQNSENGTNFCQQNQCTCDAGDSVQPYQCLENQANACQCPFNLMMGNSGNCQAIEFESGPGFEFPIFESEVELFQQSVDFIKALSRRRRESSTVYDDYDYYLPSYDAAETEKIPRFSIALTNDTYLSLPQPAMYAFADTQGCTRYYVGSFSIDYNSAKQECERHGMQLPIVTNSIEATLLKELSFDMFKQFGTPKKNNTSSYYQSSLPFWIGLKLVTQSSEIKNLKEPFYPHFKYETLPYAQDKWGTWSNESPDMTKMLELLKSKITFKWVVPEPFNTKAYLQYYENYVGDYTFPYGLGFEPSQFVKDYEKQTMNQCFYLSTEYDQVVFKAQPCQVKQKILVCEKRTCQTSFLAELGILEEFVEDTSKVVSDGVIYDDMESNFDNGGSSSDYSSYASHQSHGYSSNDYQSNSYDSGF